MKVLIHFVLCVFCFASLDNAQSQIQRVDPNAVRTAKPGAAAPKEQIVLGEPNIVGTMTVDSAIAQLKNTRKFLPQQLEPAQLRQLAWAGQSVTPLIGKQQNVEFTIAPIELYFCLWPGVYRYNPASNTLDSIASVDVRANLAAAARNETALQESPCTIIITGTNNPTATMPREQMRNAMMFVAGKTAQNITLEAQSLGLGTLGIVSFDMGRIKRMARLPAQQEPLYILAVGYPVAEKQEQTQTVKRVLFIMPGSSRPDELFTTEALFQQEGIKTIIAQSGQNLIRTESMQRQINPDITNIQNINVTDYDAIIPIGAAGDPAFSRNPVLLRIVRDTVNQGKIVGTMGETTAILVNAGVLNGVRVTGDPLILNRSGATNTGNLVESDRGIVTALNNQPSASTLFASQIIKALKGPNTDIRTNRQATQGQP